jgi:nucleoside phosphorylase
MAASELPQAVVNPTPPTVVIVTALDVETDAVLRHLGGNWTDEDLQGTLCYRGKFEGWDVVVVETGPGNSTAGIIAGKVLSHYAPDLALFVGVAGGIKDVKLGDVVAASKIHAYESGKDTDKGFEPRAKSPLSAHALEQRARAMRKRNEWRQRLDPNLKREDEPELHVGPIAAGEKVVASQVAPTAEGLKAAYGDTLAVEMEGWGFLEALRIHTVLGIVIRGISDMLSGKSASDKAGWQTKAADAASAVAFELLSKLHSTPKAGAPRVPPGSAASAMAVADSVSKPATSGSGASAPAASGPAFLETKSTLNAASFFDQGEVLARVGVRDVDEVLFSFQELPDGFVRVIPKKGRAKPLPFAELLEKAPYAPLLKTRQYGALASLNERGAFAYDPGAPRHGGPAPLAWGTQLFPNGELWLASNMVVIRERKGRPEWVPIPFIPALLLEQMYYDRAHAAVEFAGSQLGVEVPCDLELGVLGLKGTKLAVNTEDIRGPIQIGDVIVRRTLASADPDDINRVLLEFFEALYDATGYARPGGLFHFPPEPPHQ